MNSELSPLFLFFVFPFCSSSWISLLNTRKFNSLCSSRLWL
jgi:hypothetical protein